MFVDDFFKMEDDFKLFDLKSKEGFLVWDIIRFDVHLKYTFPEIYHSKKKHNFSFAVLIVGAVKTIRSIFIFLFLRANNIVFSFSRYLGEDGMMFDKASENVIQELQKDLIVVERFKALKKYRHPIEYNFARSYTNFFSRVFPVKLSDNILKLIDVALFNSLGERKVSFDDLNRYYSQFYYQYKFYKFFLKLKKAKRIFYVLNGVQKGLITAAHELGIEVIEMQHGRIGIDHLAYSYPDFINKEDSIILPDYFLTFGKYWGKNFNLPTSILPIGNDFFVKNKSIQEEDGSVLFISSIIHAEELSKLAIRFASERPGIQINFKLHQNEYKHIKNYLQKFKDYPAIHVYTNEYEIDFLINSSSLVVLINSTALYEALDYGKKVAIYKRVNFESHADCFDIANVFLFENTIELQNIYMHEGIKQRGVFFEEFNRAKFREIFG